MSEPNNSTFKRALSASGVGLWTWEIESDVFELDAHAVRLFAEAGNTGAPPRKLDEIRRFVHPDDQQMVFEIMSTMSQNPQEYAATGSIQAQHRIGLLGGAYRWIQVDASTWEEDGKAYAGGTFKDITSMRQSFDEMRSREDRFRQFTSLTSDYVYEVDPRAEVKVPQVVTGSFEKTTGLTLEAVAAKGGWSAIIHPDDRDMVARFVKGLMGGVGGGLDYRIIAGDGSVRWIRDHLNPVIEDGEAVKFLGAAQNITAQKRLEKAAAQSQKNEALARFSANAARDFDNLLTVILGAIELATSDDAEGPEMIRHLLETIRTAAEQAGELTRGMLLYGQRISGRPTRVEVGTVVGLATSILRQGLGRQHVLNMEIRDTPVHVLIDPAQLQLMLLNLVVNARQSMPTGGQVSLTVSQQYFDDETPPPSDLSHGSFVSIQVHDSGVGIPAETLPHIFEPFFTTKLPGEGAGLGLAACKGIVTGAGGTITAASPDEGGAEFTIYLPVEAPPAEDDVAEPRFEVALGENEAVLVVDDDPMLQRVFKRVLEEFGYEVHTCGSGSEALEAMDERIYDIVVSDVVMPGIDGIELARAVRQRWQDVPVLLMSGKAPDSDEFEALTKPIRPRELALKIREVLDA